MLNKADILKILKEYNIPTNEYWIAAGSAMVMHGIKEQTKDIDLGCTTKLFEQFVSKGCAIKITRQGRRSLCIDETMELFENWNADEIVIIDGLPVISIQSIKKLKLEIGREKDLEDIKLIDKFIFE